MLNSYNAIRILGTFLVAIVFGGSMLSAQVTERRGTMPLLEGRQYMVAFPQVWASPTEKAVEPAMQLFLASKVRTRVNVRTPSPLNDGTVMNMTVTVNANEVRRVPISVSLMAKESQKKDGYGIEVSADRPISVYTYQQWTGNGELARHLPVEAWGKNYYSMNFYQDRYGSQTQGYQFRPGQIVLVATRNNTIVNFTPPWHTEGGADHVEVSKGQTGTIELNKGEVFQIKAKIDDKLDKEFDTDLSGTLIRSNRPLGVVSGHTKVAIMRYPDVLPPTGMFAAPAHFVRNNVHDAMLPFEMAGTEFAFIPSMYGSLRQTGNASSEFGIDDDRGDVIRLIALEDGTIISEIRQNDCSEKPVSIKLKKGQSYLNTTMIDPTFIRSNKPVLAGQYGKSWAKIIPPAQVAKDGDQTLGHPTVESGMCMLEYVPSTDRWTSSALFRSPEGMDNFVNIVFRYEDIGKIRYNGVKLTSIFGGSVRQMGCTGLAYIRSAIDAGDHRIESEEPSIKWMAWTYGSLDGMNQGRAYGTPVSVDLTIPCDDSLEVVDAIICGNVKATAKILPEGIECGSIFTVYPEHLDNYQLTVYEVETDWGEANQQEVKYEVKVIDPSKNAKATIRVVTRSGKYVERDYEYFADLITFNPASIDWGVQPLNVENCRTVTISNPGVKPLVIRNLKVKVHTTAFTITPGTLVIPPGESRTVNVCATIASPEKRVDTIYAELECYDRPLTELIIRGDEPVVYVYDRDWGAVPKDDARVRKVRIENVGSVKAIITGYDEAIAEAQDKFYDFQIIETGEPLKSAFPIELDKNGVYEFNATYSPRGDTRAEGHILNLPFFANTTKNKLNAVLTGRGIDASLSVTPFDWNERVVDAWQLGKNITRYPGSVTIKNVGNTVLTVTSVSMVGSDASAFTFDPIFDDQGGIVPRQIVGDPNRDYTVNLYFTPSEIPDRAAERADYSASLVFKFEVNGVENEIGAELTGRAWQPQITATDKDWTEGGTEYEVGMVVAGAVTITNQDATVANAITGDTRGSGPLTITRIRIDQSHPDAVHFRIDPTWASAPSPANPIILSGGESIDMPVIYAPVGPGLHQVPYLMDHDAPQRPQPKLTGKAIQTGDFAVEDARFIQYYMLPQEKVVNITSSGLTTRLTLSQIEGADGVNFQVVEPTTDYIDIASGQVVPLRIRFVPVFVTRDGLKAGQTQNNQTGYLGTKDIAFRERSFDNAYIEVTDESTGSTKRINLFGDGMYLESTVGIPRDLKSRPGGSFNAPVYISDVPENINPADVWQMRLRVSYDNTIVRPHFDPAGKVRILTKNTQSDGWTVVGAAVVGDRMIEIDLRDNRDVKSPIRQSNVPICIVPFDAFLGGVQKSELPLQAYWADVTPDPNTPDDKRYVALNTNPGLVTLDLDCARELRIVQLGKVNFGVEAIAPNPVSSTTVIKYSVGFKAHTVITVYDQMGRNVTELINADQAAGTYELVADFSMLPSGTYYFTVVSGPFVSEPQVINIVR